MLTELESLWLKWRSVGTWAEKNTADQKAAYKIAWRRWSNLRGIGGEREKLQQEKHSRNLGGKKKNLNKRFELDTVGKEITEGSDTVWRMVKED